MTTPPALAEVEAPLFLKEKQIWLCWRYERPDNAKKPLKVPYYTNGHRRSGANGSEADVSQLVDFETAKKIAISKKYTGLGIAMLESTGISVLDFDDCIDADLYAHATYAEYSPSGTGIHIFVKGVLGDRKTYTKFGQDGKIEQFGLEIFSTKGFITYSGHSLELTELTDCTNTISEPNTELLRLIDTRFHKTESVLQNNSSVSVHNIIGLSIEQLSETLKYVSPDIGYHEWVQIGMALHHETNGSNEGFILWDTWSANSEKYSTESYNQSKWNSFGNKDGKIVTARSLLKLAQSGGCTISANDLTDADFQLYDLAPLVGDVVTNTSTTVTKSDYKMFFEKGLVSDIADILPPVDWLIDNLLPKAELGVLYGDAGTGKSFLALDLCAAIVRGVNWNGLTVSKKGRVLYVVAEGRRGFMLRYKAYQQHYGLSAEDLPLEAIYSKMPDLLSDVSVNQLVSDFKHSSPYDLIVIDTLAQVTLGGNESSSEDMGKVIGNCKRLSEASGAMILLVHHSGKDATKGARGHSSLRGASDVMLEVLRDGEERSMSVAKQKDEEQLPDAFGFSLENVVLEVTPTGKEIRSCVLDYHPVVKAIKSSGMRKNQKFVVDIARELQGGGDWFLKENALDLCMEEYEKYNNFKDGKEKSNKRAMFLRVLNDHKFFKTNIKNGEEISINI